MASGIENYPGFLNISGAELISRMREQVLKNGILVEEKEVLSLVKEKKQLHELQ